MAADYAIVKVELNGKAVGDPLDLYNCPDVLTSGEITLGKWKLEAGPHKLAIAIAGTNPAVVPVPTWWASTTSVSKRIQRTWKRKMLVIEGRHLHQRRQRIKL